MLLLSIATCSYAQRDALLACMGRLAADERFAPITGKLAVGVNSDTTFAMLADTSLASTGERRAISEWAAQRSECIKAEDRYGRSSYRPPMQALGTEAENKVMAAAVDLYNRKINFGEFNRRRQAIVDEQRVKVAAVLQQIQTQKAAQEQADRQSRELEQMQKTLSAQEQADRQALAAQIQALQAQQAQDDALKRNAPSPSVVRRADTAPVRARVGAGFASNCFRFGSQMTCTTR